MKLNFEINNQAKIKLIRKKLEVVVLNTLKKSKLHFLEKKNISISLAIVEKKEIKKLNRIYRKKNKATDVLSFSEYKNIKDLKKEKRRVIFLGEIIICPVYVKKYAVMKKIDFQKELFRVVSHGVLHLLGFKHGKKMFEIQDEVSLLI